jgi:cytochrome b involved in lipid metabolism
MQTRNTIISIIIGLVIIAGSFLAVFGSSLKNLKNTNSETETPLVTDNSTPSKPVTQTPSVKPAETDEDDQENDADDAPATKPTTTGTVPPKTTPAPTPMTTTGSGYAMADVQKHNSATTCWSAVNGTVYDLTSWVNAHPGGKAAILMICGKDGSALFNAQHGGSGKVANILAKFKIGALS